MRWRRGCRRTDEGMLLTVCYIFNVPVYFGMFKVWQKRASILDLFRGAKKTSKILDFQKKFTLHFSKYIICFESYSMQHTYLTCPYIQKGLEEKSPYFGFMYFMEHNTGKIWDSNFKFTLHISKYFLTFCILQYARYLTCPYVPKSLEEKEPVFWIYFIWVEKTGKV